MATGIGLTLTPHPPSGALMVTQLDPEGPAAKGGLVMPYDLLFEVDETSVVGLHAQQVRTLILGAPGSPVMLGLRRQNGKLFYVRIQRAPLKPASMRQPSATQPQPQQPQQPPAPQTQSLPQQGQQLRRPAAPPPTQVRRQDAPRPVGSAPADADLVGIGIGLALDSEHNLVISSLMPGSPALRSGLVEEGDILRNVDGRDVRGLVPEDVRPMILGKTGTFVTVSVQRGNTQIVARMARARAVTDVASLQPPRAGSTVQPKTDSQTLSAVYSQVTADTRRVENDSSQLPSHQQMPPNQMGPPMRQPSSGGPMPPGLQQRSLTKDGPVPPDQELCGIGIMLAQNTEGELLVLSMNEGGPAARSNLIKKDDVLYNIDGTDVYKKTIDDVRPLILGLPGSTVVLGFQRPGMKSNRLINVRLRRGNIKADLNNIPNPSPRPSPSATPGGGATPKQSPSQTPKQSPFQTPVSTRPSSPKLQSRPREDTNMPSMLVRPTPSMEAQSEENKYGPDGPVCGLGIVLVPTPVGTLCVASITEGGPAARSGRIARGDFVETIDGVSVKGMSISSVRPLILGRAGTSVTLGLRRESEDTVVYVRVMREPVRLGEVLVPGVRVDDPSGDGSPMQQQMQQMQQQQMQQQQMQQQMQQMSSMGQRQGMESAQVQRMRADEERAAYEREIMAQREAQQQREREVMLMQQQQQQQQQQLQQQQQQQQSLRNASASHKPQPRMCGVGVVLVQVAGGAVCVKAVNRGGPAHLSNMIQRGDVLFAVDGVRVLGWDVERVKPLILGPEGTNLTLSFQRVGSQVQGKRGYDVTLTRAAPPATNPAPNLYTRAPFETAALG